MREALEVRPALRPLARRDFSLLLAGSALVGILMPFHLLTQIFWVDQLYPERAVLYAGLLAASRGAAMVLFSLLGGAIADRVERRRVLLACEVFSLGANAVIAVLMITAPFGELTVLAVAAWTFLAGGIQSIDSPARSASIPTAAGPENVPAAMALLSIANQITMPLSLPLVGFLNEVMSPGAVYAVSLLAWAGILPLIALLRFRSKGGGGQRRGILGDISEGIRYSRSRRPILAVVAIVMTVQVLGLPVATPLGPMFEIEVLHFSSAQVGLMGAAWGLGSLSASLFFARLRWLPLRGSTLAVLATLFAVGILGFGYSRWIPLTAGADYVMGFAFAGTSLVAVTLIQHLVDDSMRGRVLSLFPLSLGLAQIGTAVAGAVGEATGLAMLLPALGWATLAGCALIVFTFRGLVGERVPWPIPPTPAAVHPVE